MVNDIPPGSGAFHCWPGSHLRTHPLWTTRFGNVKTKEQEDATREEVAAIVADTGAIGTCTTNAGTSCIDFVLVSRDMAEAASKVANAPIATHRPVLLEVRADAAGLKRVAMKMVQNIPP